MADFNDSRRRASFPREGFLVHWGRQGVRISVTDYHADPLTIPWDMIDEWRAVAGEAQMRMRFDDPEGPAAPEHGPGRRQEEQSRGARSRRGKKKVRRR